MHCMIQFIVSTLVEESNEIFIWTETENLPQKNHYFRVVRSNVMNFNIIINNAATSICRLRTPKRITFNLEAICYDHRDSI